MGGRLHLHLGHLLSQYFARSGNGFRIGWHRRHKGGLRGGLAGWCRGGGGHLYRSEAGRRWRGGSDNRGRHRRDSRCSRCSRGSRCRLCFRTSRSCSRSRRGLRWLALEFSHLLPQDFTGLGNSCRIGGRWRDKDGFRGGLGDSGGSLDRNRGRRRRWRRFGRGERYRRGWLRCGRRLPGLHVV